MIVADREREGYILIDRNILEWKWWQKHNTLVVFLWLLLKAQFHDSYFLGEKIERGQVATSIDRIAKTNNLTYQTVRTALEHLKSTGEITITRCSKFIVITIVNYNKYQDLTIKSTNNQQSNNNQSTINQQYTNTDNTDNKRERRKRGRSAPASPPGISDVPYAAKMKPIGEGTVNDIPVEFRDICQTYEEYWRLRNR